MVYARTLSEQISNLLVAVFVVVLVAVVGTVGASAAPEARARDTIQCPAFPKVALWGDISHQSTIRHVERKMKGDWAAYLKRLSAIRDQLRSIHARKRGAELTLRNRRITLSGGKLLDYLKLVERRIAVVECLRMQARGTVFPAKAPVNPISAGTHGAVYKFASKPTSKPAPKPATRGAHKGNPAVGQGLSVICVDCHGEGGVNDDPLTPNLAGQNFAYLAKQLMSMRDSARDRAGAENFDESKRKESMEKFQNFLKSERTAEFMDEAVLNLSNEQIMDLAAYYVALPCGQSTPVNEFAVPPLISQRCVACHGEKGVSTQARFPNIAGQHQTYLRDQLIDFKIAGLEAMSGSKNISRNKSMAMQVAELRHNEIEELAIYYAQQSCRKQ